MKILTFTSLFPNSVFPHHGVFVENRLRHLLATNKVQSKVVAPVPWFPFSLSSFGDYAKFAKVEQVGKRHDIDIYYPRHLVIPKIGMNWTPDFIVKSALPVIKKIMADGYDFDLIDAHYFYPDGIAAVKIAKILDKPVTITARGTDLNLIPQYPKPKKMIQWAANEADALITVCAALRDVLIDMGIAENKVTALRNGVDLTIFSLPLSRSQLQNDLSVSGKTILSVGHLIERKGHDLIIKALEKLPDVQLIIAGIGEEKDNLESLVKQLGLENRVRFLGLVPHDDLKKYYGAVDALVLASSREGWANVLLESMACGTPVVATNIWGTPEVVASNEAGVLVERNPQSIADGIQRLFENYPNREATRKYAEQFSWDDTTQGQLDIFENILN